MPQNKTILIVEDEDNLRNSLSELLKFNQSEVWQAENGKVALSLLNANGVPDLIISDIVMPVMDGVTLCKTLQADERYKFIPFIFLTAKAELDEIRTGMATGADDYITKPVKYADLIKAIDLRLAKRKSLVNNISNSIESQTENGNSERKSEMIKMLGLFTTSEKRVLKALAEDKISKIIAQRLFLSIKTVQNHRSHMVLKLGMSGQNSLLAFAVEANSLGLLKI
jgi:DNA-binding NarL/FixJ family response regulator